MSKIFTIAEKIALSKRIMGDKKDPTGIYSSRVKPKITEIIEVWLPQRKILKSLIKQQRKPK